MSFVSLHPDIEAVHAAAIVSDRVESWLKRACKNFKELLRLEAIVNNALRKERAAELTGDERNQLLEAFRDHDRLVGALSTLRESAAYKDFLALSWNEEDLIKWAGKERVSVGYMGRRERGAEHYLRDIPLVGLPYGKTVADLLELYHVAGFLRIPTQEEAESNLLDFLEWVKKWDRPRLSWVLKNVCPLDDDTGGFWAAVSKVLALTTEEAEAIVPAILEKVTEKPPLPPVVTPIPDKIIAYWQPSPRGLPAFWVEVYVNGKLRVKGHLEVRRETYEGLSEKIQEKLRSSVEEAGLPVTRLLTERTKLAEELLKTVPAWIIVEEKPPIPPKYSMGTKLIRKSDKKAFIISDVKKITEYGKPTIQYTITTEEGAELTYVGSDLLERDFDIAIPPPPTMPETISELKAKIEEEEAKRREAEVRAEEEKRRVEAIAIAVEVAPPPVREPVPAEEQVVRRECYEHFSKLWNEIKKSAAMDVSIPVVSEHTGMGSEFIRKALGYARFSVDEKIEKYANALIECQCELEEGSSLHGGKIKCLKKEEKHDG